MRGGLRLSRLMRDLAELLPAGKPPPGEGPGAGGADAREEAGPSSIGIGGGRHSDDYCETLRPLQVGGRPPDDDEQVQ